MDRAVESVPDFDTFLLQNLQDFKKYVKVTPEILDKLYNQNIITEEQRKEFVEATKGRPMSEQSWHLIRMLPENSEGTKRAQVLQDVLDVSAGVFIKEFLNSLTGKGKEQTVSESSEKSIRPSAGSVFDILETDEDVLVEEEYAEEDLRIIKQYKPEKYETAGRRRYALIINNVDFDSAPSNKREGSTNMAKRLGEVLKKTADFKVVRYKKNCRPEDIDTRNSGSILSAFIREIKSTKATAVLVYIMSHGNEKEEMMMSDSSWIEYYPNILDKFNNEKCQELVGIPKMFFLQLCRGNKLDFGCKILDRPLILSSSEKKLMQAPKFNPKWADMLVVHSTFQEHVSVRTWMTYDLCAAIEERGRELDVCELLNVVNQVMMSKWYPDGTAKATQATMQICPFYNIAFGKKFYFCH